MTLKLYYSPGACSLSPHIALREADLPFELVQVDLKDKQLKEGGSYLTVTSKGYVPAIRLVNGEVLTENAVILQYIADLAPGRKLAPPAGTLARYRLQEWLNFLGTELQKSFGPIFNPKSNDDIRQFYTDRLLARFAVLARTLEGNSYLLGDTFTVADAYAFYTLRSLQRIESVQLKALSVLNQYWERLSARPAVQSALVAEGLA